MYQPLRILNGYLVKSRFAALKNGEAVSEHFRSAEQENFYRRLSEHFRSPTGPLLLEGTTGLGKTRAYLSAVVELVQQGHKVAVVLPTHMLIEQLLASSDVAKVVPSEVSVKAFLPRSRFEDRQSYTQHKESALSAEVMLCTSASVIIDQRLGGDYNGVTKRDAIIFDEADQLPEAAALQSDCEIKAIEFSELGIKKSSAPQMLLELLSKKGLEPEIRAAALLIQEELEEPAWFKQVGVTDDGGVMLFHRLPGRLLKRIANRPNVAFISATLSVGGSFDDFKRAMGISTPSELSGSIEPKHHGSLRFHVADLEVGSQEWLEGTMRSVRASPKPCLVVTPSHDLAETLAALLPGCVLRARDETSSEAASRMGVNDILVAAGAWAGMDTPIVWKSIVVPRIPYERPVVLDDQVESSFLHTRNTAIRRMRQVIGRGLRTPDASCDIYISDGRFRNIEAFVPKRFGTQWQGKEFLEGERKEVVLSRAERDPTVRKKALAHFGKRCMVCDFVPRVDSQLEVHHLFPLADGGERLTSIDDVAVLCANCHRLAHSAGLPPLTLDQMRALDRLCNFTPSFAQISVYR